VKYILIDCIRLVFLIQIVVWCTEKQH